MSAMIDPRIPTERELRWFGALLLAVFAVLGGLVYVQTGALRVAGTLWGVGAALALLLAWLPPLRRPTYDAWMALVSPVGWAFSHLVLAVVFYGMITPVALVFRLFGRDKLERRADPSAESYWVAHDPGGDAARYFRQS